VSQIYKPLTSSGPIPPNIPTQFTTDDGNHATPAENNINVFGASGTGISTSSSGSTITISVINDGFKWFEETTSFAAAIQTGYFCNNALTVTLPPTAGLLIGATIIIYADTPQMVIVQANTGQMIEVGGVISGAGGTSTSGTAGSMLGLVFKPSDTTWHAVENMGTWSTI
jgi:hypothetical protein